MKALYFAMLGTALLINACGGDGGVGSGGTGITAGFQSGTVSGFGSVIIEGNKYDDSIAAIEDDSDPSTVKSVPLANVKLGMQVRAIHDGEQRINNLKIVPAIIGIVNAVIGDTITVTGQTVTIKPAISGNSFPTVFDGFIGTAGVAVNDKILVFGFADTNGRLTASRIELLDDSIALTRVVGNITSLSSSGSTQRFKIGELSVDSNAATTKLAGANALAEGDRVTVYSNSDVFLQGTSPSVTAGTIRKEERETILSIGLPWRLGGPIAQLNTGAKTFKIGENTVSYSSANFGSTSANQLQNGVIVRATGLAPSGVLNATEIQVITASEPVKITLSGVLTDFTSVNSFKVRGTSVHVTAATVFIHGAALNLTDGVLVDIEGMVVNGTVQASKVEFKIQQDNRTTAFQGAVSGFVPSTGTFDINGVASRVTAATIYKKFDGSSTVASSFVNGAVVKVTGSFSASQGVFLVDEVRLGNNSVSEVKLEGIATVVNVDQRTLVINGTTVTWTPQTEIINSAGLKRGALIKVQGLSGLTGISATKLEAKSR
jgi:Domain of unknown function (DUF5666)